MGTPLRLPPCILPRLQRIYCSRCGHPKTLNDVLSIGISKVEPNAFGIEGHHLFIDMECSKCKETDRLTFERFVWEPEQWLSKLAVLYGYAVTPDPLSKYRPPKHHLTQFAPSAAHALFVRDGAKLSSLLIHGGYCVGGGATHLLCRRRVGDFITDVEVRLEIGNRVRVGPLKTSGLHPQDWDTLIALSTGDHVLNRIKITKLSWERIESLIQDRIYNVITSGSKKPKRNDGA